MIERIKALVDCKAKSVREFSRLINVKQVTLNQQLAGTRGLSLEIVLAILNSFESVSAEWLLRGTGAMFISENSNNNEVSTDNDEVQFLRNRIISLEAENRVLRELVGLRGEKSEREKTA